MLQVNRVKGFMCEATAAACESSSNRCPTTIVVLQLCLFCVPLRDRTIANFFIGGCGRIIADFLRELLQIPKFQFIYLNPWSGSWELEMEMGDGSGSGVGWGERLDYRCFMDCAGELVQQSVVT